MKHFQESKFQTEVKPIRVDMRDRLLVGESISMASVTCTVASGEDASPNDMLSGLATVVNNAVEQKVIGGIPGVIYILWIATKSSFGNLYVDTIPLAILASEAVVFFDFRITDDGEPRVTESGDYRILDAA